MLTRLPNFVLEAFRTSVKMIRTIVDRKRIFYAVKSELSKSDTVRKSSWHLSRAWAISEIAHRIRITKADIRQCTVLVWNNHRHHASSDA